MEVSTFLKKGNAAALGLARMHHLIKLGDVRTFVLAGLMEERAASNW